MSQTVRYFFEHRLLPQEFFANPGHFVDHLKEGRVRLFDALSKCYMLNDSTCPYEPNQFQVVCHPLAEEATVACLTFPEPQDLADCYWAYLFWDPSSGHHQYFTVEKSHDGRIVLGEWQSGKHLNHGYVLPEEATILGLCQNRFQIALANLKSEQGG